MNNQWKSVGNPNGNLLNKNSQTFCSSIGPCLIISSFTDKQLVNSLQINLLFIQLVIINNTIDTLPSIWLSVNLSTCNQSIKKISGK